MTRRQYAGGAARTTIVGSISSTGGGTVVIADVTGWPDGSIGKFHVIVDPGTSAEEKILVDSRSGTTLSFSSGERGADGTVPTSHSPGAKIWHCLAALDADEANAHTNSAVAAHPASAISFTPTAGIAATTVQAAIAELESEAADARLDAIEAPNWVTQIRMADNSVGAAELIDGNVTAAKIADVSVTTAKIADGNVTFAKLAPVAVSRWTRVATQSISAGTEVVISWTAEVEDDLSLTTTPFTVITMPAGSDGWWGIDLSLHTDASLSLTGYFEVRRSVSFAYRNRNGVDTAADIGTSWCLYLVEGNSIDIRVFNNSGGTVNVSAASLVMARLAKTA